MKNLPPRIAFESDKPLLILSASEAIDDESTPITALLQLRSDLTNAGFTNSLHILSDSKPAGHDNAAAHEKEPASCD